MSDSSLSIVLQSLLDRLKSGDPQARDELIGYSYERLLNIARRHFHSFQRLRAWEESTDVTQNAAMRLRRALETERPEKVLDFVRLAGEMIHRELLDLSRKHFGRKGNKSERRPLNVFGQMIEDHNEHAAQLDPAQKTDDPVPHGFWEDFHEVVAKLPDIERETVILLFYQQLKQAEAAEILNVDVRTVKRRWLSARKLIRKGMKDWDLELPNPSEESVE